MIHLAGKKTLISSCEGLWEPMLGVTNDDCFACRKGEQPCCDGLKMSVWVQHGTKRLTVVPSLTLPECGSGAPRVLSVPP